MFIVYSLVLIITGMFLLGFGKKYFKRALLLAIFLGSFLGLNYLITTLSGSDSIGIVITSFIVSLFFVAISFFFFEIAIFVSGGGLLTIVLLNISSILQIDENSLRAVALLSFIIGGVLSLVFRKAILVILTASLGATITTLGLLIVSNLSIDSIDKLIVHLNTNQPTIRVFTLILFVASILFQTYSYKFFNKKVVA